MLQRIYDCGALLFVGGVVESRLPVALGPGNDASYASLGKGLARIDHAVLDAEVAALEGGPENLLLLGGGAAEFPREDEPELFVLL